MPTSTTLSLYNASIPVFVRGLNQLSYVLDKGDSHARSAGTGVERLYDAKLAPDMLSLAGQVQAATDIARAATARICSGMQPSPMSATKTYADLKSRIAKTLTYLEQVDRAAVDDAGEQSIAVTLPDRTLNYTALRYVQEFAVPNFYFHLIAAYCLLRSNAVPLQKLDLIGAN
ncbi:conserved hypothetical protein [Burkholderiales bacterium 8X]|nr:conserved hypothetical protein [Burkholderiales bacterium 8X]